MAQAVTDQILTIRDLTKTFGSTVALDGVSIDIDRGELVTLLGPSGSGKSTVLGIVAGFEQPTSGDILIEGRSVTTVAPNRRNIGMVFQRYTLFPHLSAAENVAFPLRVRGVASGVVAERVRDALDLVRLGEYGGRRPDQLSGGQQQRVAIARALVYEPSILLLDEPLAALDKRLREEIQLEIRQLHDRLGVTMLFVTHDQSEALRLSDRIAVMNEGRVAQIGDGITLYDRPDSRFVAEFIGDSNMLDGRAIDVEATGMIVDVGGVNVTAPRRDGIAPGDLVSVMFRPEKARIVCADSESSGENALDIAIGDTINLGDGLMIDGVRNDGQTLRVKARRDDIGEVRAGQTARIVWPVEETLVFGRDT